LVGVRSLDGSGSQQWGVALSAPPAIRALPLPAGIGFELANTGAPAAGGPAVLPEHSSYDIYRLSVSVDAPGWTAALDNELAAVRFGAARPVAVRVQRAPGAPRTATVILTARSESDPGKSAQAEVVVHAENE